MTHALLIQLPIPQINFGKCTANVPLAGACLKQAGEGSIGTAIDILPESVASYLGDAALTRYAVSARPEMVGFTVYNWNLHRSIYLAKMIKQSCGAKIIFGGPEITPDNPFIQTDVVDYIVMGEGESAFKSILKKNSRNLTRAETGMIKKGKTVIKDVSDNRFISRPSPYLSNLLEPQVNGLMYLESQRGCIYRCGFCYYNKSRKTMAIVHDDVVVNAVKWARDLEVTEICIIDPSFNARPGLHSLLEKIADINKDHKISLNGEIRAEFVDQATADLFANAGFTSFEIGLQSTNPKALRIMNRKTDLRKFLKGTTLLKERGIIPKIDLIVGLPGDDLTGFKQSLIFIAENNLADDIQIFPLSVLPGTMFRQKSLELGLSYDENPPYLIKKTPTFSLDDIYLSFDYAESLFDVSLFPAPYLDIAFKNNGDLSGNLSDIMVPLNHNHYIKTIILNSIRPLGEIGDASRKMTSPYQVLIERSVKNMEFICEAIKILTQANPFTPLEIIFLNPETIPDTQLLLSCAKIYRLNYLDIYNTYQYTTPGNRSVLFTLVSDKLDLFFEGEMKRQIFFWEKPTLPEKCDLEDLSDFDGILIDTEHPSNAVMTWQDRMAPHAGEMIYISFADIAYQKRWLRSTASDEFSGLFL
jgi:radical SAM superfamily enzyme YgiQ (UPF0313 family)